MYAEHWGLQRQPFENTNDPAFLFASAKHKEGLARLRYAVMQKKLGILVVGEYGTGKTYLSRALKQYLPLDSFRLIYVTNPRMTPSEFINTVIHELGAEITQATGPTKSDLLRVVRDSLENCGRQGIHVVIFIDEAQSIEDVSLLEEIRLLMNIQGEEQGLFTLVLLGQPHIQDKIERIPQLKQRLSIRYRLTPLTEEETEQYIDHRLAVAGAARRLFTGSACREIYALSKGMPREINNICDLALLTGFVEGAQSVDKDTVQRVKEDIARTEE